MSRLILDFTTQDYEDVFAAAALDMQMEGVIDFSEGLYEVAGDPRAIFSVYIGLS